MSVRYVLSEFLEAGFIGHGGYLQLDTNADPDVACAAFTAATDVGDEIFDDEAEDFVSTAGVTRTLAGPVVRINLCDSEQVFSDWLQVVADELERAGVSGRLVTASSIEAPLVNAPALSAVLQVTVEYEQILAGPHIWNRPVRRWWVDPKRTERVLGALLDWCLDTPGDAFMRTRYGMRLEPEQMRIVVAANFTREAKPNVVRISDDRRRMRCFQPDAYGGVIVQTYGPDLSWSQHLEALQPLLVRLAPDLTHGLIRPLDTRTSGNFHAWRARPATPMASGPQGWTFGMSHWPILHLLGDHVPDAYAQQILTDAHLQHLGPLPPDRWRIEPLGNQRHLLTAHDPAPWLDVDPRPYGPGDDYTTRPSAPDQATLDQARTDMGAALLTPETLAAHPTPPLTGPKLLP